MHKANLFVSVLLLSALSAPSVAFAADAVSRRDAFVQIWRSTSRPVGSFSEKAYLDVPKGSVGYEEITFAKARGLLSDGQDTFYPDAPATPSDVLRWIFRTRSVEKIDAEGRHVLTELANAEDIPALAQFYGISYNPEATSISQEQMLSVMRDIDAALEKEEHEVSLYSEKFHGKGTAFGETFNMNALTAAHRTYPHNTLVKVTNIENGKSVTVRINDRGPYVVGRDMDLSLASFTTIAERSKGKIMARFERQGDINIVQRCLDDRFQRRITRDVILDKGVPHTLPLGAKLRLESKEPFVVRNIIYPDGTETGTHTWVTKGEAFELVPSVTGLYTLWMGTKLGRVREMRMTVVDCGGQ
jgi:hypothetical protein